MKIEREFGFLKRHWDLMVQAYENGDLHTVEFLAGVLVNTLFELIHDLREGMKG